jgi:hypothetical protein
VRRPIVTVFLVALLVVSLPMQVSHVAATGPDNGAMLYVLVDSGQEEIALQLVVEAAVQRGGWGPAPGNTVVYDPTLPWNVRAEVMVPDLLPVGCSVPKLARLTEECGLDLVSQQDLVRFGRSTFVNLQPGGSALPRPAFDDLLSTYIEEVSHSWQEYLFETERQGGGPRVRKMSWDEVSYWSHGWEYQAKRYVLSLDGILLSLSDEEREALKGYICTDDGYANPLGHEVPDYAAPAGWPNPDGWPTTTPTLDELQAFCA